MAQLSISLDAETSDRLEKEVERGDFQSKSALVKKAILEYLRECAYERIQRGQREYATGRAFKLKGTLAAHIRSTKV
jgi:Arc/MetJ-type ribon-helix-helix transcriptional regulator